MASSCVHRQTLTHIPDTEQGITARGQRETRNRPCPAQAPYATSLLSLDSSFHHVHRGPIFATSSMQVASQALVNVLGKASRSEAPPALRPAHGPCPCGSKVFCTASALGTILHCECTRQLMGRVTVGTGTNIGFVEGCKELGLWQEAEFGCWVCSTGCIWGPTQVNDAVPRHLHGSWILAEGVLRRQPSPGCCPALMPTMAHAQPYPASGPGLPGLRDATAHPCAIKPIK